MGKLTTALCVLGMLVILASDGVNSAPVELEFDPVATVPQRDARFFGFRNRLEDYSPHNYYGYGYRPFWGNFGGYLGFFGK
ncbi:hypothetical protein GHT06_012575 [Daphnia sinensis]|uniref:Secreted protein n=1 Tax=Daphnia sinensis TaxID=1820382 RepID=A0AAD5PZY1_9CRUS|nr:hypothetical protein GHT06_012575 [Daphnia sinensis]